MQYFVLCVLSLIISSWFYIILGNLFYLITIIIIYFFLGYERALSIAESIVGVFDSSVWLVGTFFLIGFILVTVYELSGISRQLLYFIKGFKEIELEQKEELMNKLPDDSLGSNFINIFNKDILVDENCEVPVATSTRSGEIIITPSILKLPDHQTAAILGHEIYHIEHRDYLLDKLFVILAYPYHLLSFSYDISYRVLDKLRFFEQKGLWLVFIWPYYLFHLALSIVRYVYFQMRKWGAQSREYDADRYVIQMGLKDGLQEHLKKLLETSLPDIGFWAWHFRVHPDLSERVIRLND